MSWTQFGALKRLEGSGLTQEATREARSPSGAHKGHLLLLQCTSQDYRIIERGNLRSKSLVGQVLNILHALHTFSRAAKS